MEGKENIAAALRNAVAAARIKPRRSSEAAASAATTGHTGTPAGPAGSAPSASFGQAAAKGQGYVQTGISIRVTLFRRQAIFTYYWRGPQLVPFAANLFATCS
jgi:hypothetical protein